MTDRVKAPSGRDIWKAVREELRLNLLRLPYSTLAPTVYHVYLHPDDFLAVEGIMPRVVSELQVAADVGRISRRLTTRRRRVLGRLLQQDNLAPVEVPLAGWDIRVASDQDGELRHGQLGIISSLTLPAAAGGRRNADHPDREASSAPDGERAPPRTSRKARTHEAFNGPNPPIVARARG